jgi:hypothetical protein
MHYGHIGVDATHQVHAAGILPRIVELPPGAERDGLN